MDHRSDAHDSGSPVAESDTDYNRHLLINGFDGKISNCKLCLNPLPHMPILGSSKSAANIDMSRKYSGKRRNCSL